MKITNLAKNSKILLLVLLLATVLRFANPVQNPPSLNWDEISHGYSAYSILKTGRDEWGVALPTIFRAYGDYKLPVYIYLTAVSEFFFGLTPFAVRLPSMLAGIGTVALTYFLVGELFPKRSRELGLLAALLVAVEPWSLFLSRAAFEANLSLTFIVAGVYLFLKSLSKAKHLIPASALFGLSVWTYNSARVFVPLLLISLVLIYRSELHKLAKNSKRIIIFSLFVIGMFFLPMFWQLATSAGQARYGEVAVLDEGAIAKIIESRNTSNLTGIGPRLVYNKATYFAKEFVNNYLRHFSPDFLFFNGGTQYQFSIPEKGLVYLLNAPFVALGLAILLFDGVKCKNGTQNGWRIRRRLIIVWLLLSPIPSSLTREAPHVLRSVVMLPVPMVLTAVGLVSVAEWLSRKGNYKVALSAAYGLLLFGFAESYLFDYFMNYRNNYSWSWQYGYEQVVGYAKDNYDKYDKIVVTKKYGEPHEFFLFYNKWDPASYRSDPNLVRFEQSNWFWVDGFDKYYFVNDWQINEEGIDSDLFVLESGDEVDCSDAKCLLITSPGNTPTDWEKLETVNFLDSQPAFEIYEN